MAKKKKTEPTEEVIRYNMYSGSEKNKQDLQDIYDIIESEDKRRAEKATEPKQTYKPLDPKNPLDKSIMDLERHVRKWSKFQGMYGNKAAPSGGGGMSPVDIEKVPGKRPLKMVKGGLAVRGYGIAKRPAKKVIKKAK